MGLPIILGGLAALGGGYLLTRKPKTATPAQVAASVPLRAAPLTASAPVLTGPLTAEANASANVVQPQPPNQPPLPPALPVELFFTPKRMQVVTKDTGQAGALRIRSAPSTTAPAVTGGEPGTGGGVPHLAYVVTTGPENLGFVPIKYNNLVGWVWAGYLGGDVTDA